MGRPMPLPLSMHCKIIKTNYSKQPKPHLCMLQLQQLQHPSLSWALEGPDGVGSVPPAHRQVRAKLRHQRRYLEHGAASVNGHGPHLLQKRQRRCLVARVQVHNSLADFFLDRSGISKLSCKHGNVTMSKEVNSILGLGLILASGLAL